MVLCRIVITWGYITYSYTVVVPRRTLFQVSCRDRLDNDMFYDYGSVWSYPDTV